jgi:class 3 adenylate cyclase
LKALRQKIVDPAIASHGGRIVKTTGDGLATASASQPPNLPASAGVAHARH